MLYRLLLLLSVVGSMLGGTAVHGHFSMLLPEAASTKKGVPVTLLYQWGHPFEHQLFNAPPPERLEVFAPDGKRTDLTKLLEKVTAVATEGKPVTAYRLRFVPELRGDYTFLLSAPPIWMEEDKEFLQDTVQVVLHVQAQKGWSVDTGARLKLVPLTRPYGLQPGMVFQAQALAPSSKSLAGSLVEIEHYNPRPPATLPPDEVITRTARTDPNGVVTATLLEPGWWCITAQQSAGERERDGKRYPIRQRCTLWVFVDPPFSGTGK